MSYVAECVPEEKQLRKTRLKIDFLLPAVLLMERKMQVGKHLDVVLRLPVGRIEADGCLWKNGQRADYPTHT